MDKQSTQSSWAGFVVFLIGLLAAAGVMLWRLGPSLVSAENNNLKATEKKSSPAPATDVLKSQLAGRWYPDDANLLSRQIDGFFKQADVNSMENVIAFILPHAGYQFSGQTAACGLKATDKLYDRIIVIGPSHRVRLEETLSVPRVTHYQTPLGLIPLDTDFIEKLLTYSLFQSMPFAHKYEHSVQIELPLLQFRQKDFRLVPIVAGDCSCETISKAGKILAGMIDNKTLVVASSDFVHYGPRYGYVPFSENVPEQIKKLDMGAYEYIAGLDGPGFLQYKRRTGATICGGVPIAILLSMLDSPTKARLIKYETSGRVTGDFSNSVSYLSVAFSGRWRNPEQVKSDNPSARLTTHDKQQLLTLARKTILYALEKKRLPQPGELDVAISPAMEAPRAAFVTLKKNSQLRGCIGDIFPQRPLYRSVIINAVNAAFNDRRFVPLQQSECSEIEIEISALTAPAPVDSPNEIRVGTDGMIIRKDGRSAVYLPQVAPEQGWNLEQTLTHLSQKAGLDPNAWKQGAAFLVFQADVFGEEK